MRTGWRGESYRHYLAAKGVKTSQKQYYSKFEDILSRTLSRAEREKSARISTYSDPYKAEATPGSQAVLLRSRMLSDQARSTPLTQEEAKQIAEKKLQQEEYDLQRRSLVNIGVEGRRVFDRNELIRRKVALDSYQSDLNSKIALAGVEKEKAEAEIAKGVNRILQSKKMSFEQYQNLNKEDRDKLKTNALIDAEYAAQSAKIKQNALKMVRDNVASYSELVDEVDAGTKSPIVLTQGKWPQVWLNIKRSVI